MREGRNNAFLFGNDGLIALNLGADYVSEHEWGIQGIRTAFGLPDNEKTFGLAARQITKVPDGCLQWGEGQAEVWEKGKRKTVEIAGFAYEFHRKLGHRTPIPKSMSNREDGLWTAWSDRDFGAYSVEPKGVARLKLLYNAFATKNIAIWLGGGGVFENAGLAIGIVNRLPAHVTTNWRRVDKEHHDLKQRFAKTGIEEKLKKAGKEWFALRPKLDAKGELIVLLNPMNQDRHNHGWYSIADLEAWAEDKGPVMKKMGKR